MAKTQKFIARYEGKIIGKRGSQNRIYTHAIVTQRSATAARDAAYNYTSTKHDSSEYEFHTICARAKAGDIYPGHSFEISQNSIDRARAILGEDGSFDAYVRYLRAQAIETFERDFAAGHYEPYVAAWSMSERNARKAVGSWDKPPYRNVLAIVPAESA